jgi:hypothetical protein
MFLYHQVCMLDISTRRIRSLLVLRALTRRSTLQNYAALSGADQQVSLLNIAMELKKGDHPA